VDTWRHGGGLYLEHIAAAKLTSGHGQKRQTLLLIKRKPILKISVCDTEETAQQQHATELQGVASRGSLQTLLWKAEHGVE
jgi:hypothetical protein